MSRMKSMSSAGDRPRGPERKLPVGVCHVSELMPQVLARYGLSIEEKPNAERPTVAIGVTDFYDVPIAAVESVW